MYLVDTNVISEARKGRRADPGVLSFLRGIHAEELCLAVQTVGELRQGIERLRRRGDLPQAELLEKWLGALVQDYDDRILDFDLDAAQVWGALMAHQPQNAVDRQIAAIALLHDLVVVTRNVDDFQGTGVKTLNPFLHRIAPA